MKMFPHRTDESPFIWIKHWLKYHLLLTNVFQAGPAEQCAALEVEIYHKRTIVSQDFDCYAVSDPVFLHREVDLSEKKKKHHGKVRTHHAVLH